MRCRLAADGHLYDALHVVFRHPVAGQTRLVYVDLQLGLSDVSYNAQVGNAVDGLHHLIYVLGYTLTLIEVWTIYLGHNGSLHSTHGLFYVVADGLREVKVYARID